MQRSFHRSLPIGIAAVFSVSFFAWGQLGGTQGIDVPFSGYLQEGEGAMTDDAVDFVFTVYDSALAVAPCDTYTAADVVVTDGRFATVIEDVLEACVKRKDPHIEIAVDKDQTGTGSLLAGRQRIFPAIGAYTSGTGDFDSVGLVDAATLNVRGAATTNTLAVTGAASAVNVTNNVVVGGTVDTAGGVYGGPSFLGDVGWGLDYAGFSHESFKSQTGYALLQSSGGQTILNSAPGNTMDFRVGNATAMSMSSTGNLSTRTGIAPGADEALRIVRGTVFADLSFSGEGFTVTRPATGAYAIAFSPAFASAPTIVCSTLHPTDAVNTSGAGQCMPTHPNQITSSGARIFTSSGSATQQNWAFSFIAIGPK